MFGVYPLGEKFKPVWLARGQIFTPQKQIPNILSLLQASEDETVIQIDINAYQIKSVARKSIVRIEDGVQLQMKGKPDLPVLSQALIIFIFTGQVFGQLSDKTDYLQPATDQNMVNLAEELTDFLLKIEGNDEGRNELLSHFI